MTRFANHKVPKSLRYALALVIIPLASPVVVQGVLRVTSISQSILTPYLIMLLTIAYAWCIWSIRNSSPTGMSPEEEMSYQVNAFNKHSMVTMADKQNRLTYVNDNFLLTTGYMRKELLGELTTIFYPEADLRLNRKIDQIILGGETWTGETLIEGKDGRKIWTQLTIVPRIGKRGKVIGSIAIRTDITQSKIETAERNLRQSLHIMSHEVYMFETGTLSYIYLNQAAMKRCGWDEETYTQKTIADRKIKFNNQEVYGTKAFYEHAAPLIDGDVEELEHEVLIDGRIHEVKMQLVHPEGCKSYFITLVRDISERRAFEQAKDDFISTVSHELRTPVTSIKGSLGLILSGATGELNNKTKTMLDIAHRNSDRLTLLINDILDLEKIAAGLMEFNCEPVDMGALISDIISANQSYANRLGVSLVGIGVEESIEGYCDIDRVFQVMNNLLSNAAKFSNPNSEVIVTLSQTDDKVCISVEDFGIGIAEDARDSLFEKFTQVNSSDRRSEGGTGLGLNIARALIENLGGAIGFESQLGKGTKFSFDLPKVDKTTIDGSEFGHKVAAE